MLGDDGLFMCNAEPDWQRLSNYMKVYHNMISKPAWSTKVGTFC